MTQIYKKAFFCFSMLMMHAACSTLAARGTRESAAGSRAGLKVYDVELREPLEPRDVLIVDYADINGMPIQLWVYRDRATKTIERIRVTGHATEEICLQASRAVSDFMGKPFTEGYFSFGVADAFPVPGQEERFTKEAEKLLRDFQVLRDTGHLRGTRQAGQASRDKVNVYDEIFLGADSEFKTVHDVEVSGEERVAIMGYVSAPEHGPAFVPVRVLSADGRTVVFSFEITTEDLGLNRAMMRDLAGEVSLGPWADQIERLEKELREISELIVLKDNWEQSLGAPWEYYLETTPFPSELKGASLIQFIEAETEKLGRLLRKLQAINGFAGLFIRLEMQRDDSINEQRANIMLKNDVLIAEVERAIRGNQKCIDGIRRNSICSMHENDRALFNHFYMVHDRDVEMTSEIRELARQFESWIDGLSSKELREQQKSIRSSLLNARNGLDRLRKRQRPAQRQQARAVVVDGLLRGWPLPVTSRAMAQRVDRLLQKSIPKFWERLMNNEMQQRGVDLSQQGLIAGVLQRPHLFYYVVAVEENTFKVTPMYVVTHEYMEIWDARRNLVLIETPY